MIYDQVERYYNNSIEYKQFKDIVHNVFDIPEDIINVFMKRMSVSNVTKKARIDIYSFKIMVVSIFLVIPILVYLFLSLIFGKLKKNLATIKYDIVFEGWSLLEEANLVTFNRFYKNLISKLSNYKLGYFKPYLTKNNDKNLLKKYNLGYIKNSFFINKEESIELLKKIIINYIKIVQLTFQSKINFLYLFGKVFYHYSLYTLRVQNVSEIKYLISAGDNYYDSMMYYIYKKYGIKNIYLIQTSMRPEEYLSSFYITCDKYFRFDSHIKSGCPGLKAYDNVIKICSLRLYDAISNIEKTQLNNFDIVFLETPFWNQNILNQKDHLYLHAKSYFESLELLAKFSLDFPHLKIIYRIKKNEYPKEQSIFLEKRDMILNNSNIIFDDILHKNSYEAILDSIVTVFVVTTMGVEAISLGKKVLCCNFENFNFLISQEDEIGVIVKNNYEVFKNKILTLLEDSEEIDNYFKEKQHIYGAISDNPYQIILDNIEEKDSVTKK